MPPTTTELIDNALEEVSYWRSTAINLEKRVNLAESVIYEIAEWNTIDINDLRDIARMYIEGKRAEKAR